MIGLLVDDDALFVRTLQRSLQRRGIEAVTAADVESALAAAREHAFDFALLDLKIGKESGLRLIEPLKAIRAEVRVVMMTGYASVATAVEAIKAGAYDYLLKPVSVDAILRVLTDDPIRAGGRFGRHAPAGPARVGAHPAGVAYHRRQYFRRRTHAGSTPPVAAAQARKEARSRARRRGQPGLTCSWIGSARQ